MEENVIVIDLCFLVPSHESIIKSTIFVSFQEELTVHNNNRPKVIKRRINMSINIILPILIDDNGLIEGSILLLLLVRWWWVNCIDGEWWWWRSKSSFRLRRWYVMYRQQPIVMISTMVIIMVNLVLIISGRIVTNLIEFHIHHLQR